MRSSLTLFLAIPAALLLAACSQPNTAPGLDTLGGRPLTATLTGAAEVPNPGDPDGSGTAHVVLNQGQNEVCFDIQVADIATATAAHIHAAPAGVAGGVVVNFNVPVNGLSGCVAADAELIKAIRQTPEDYYVNVHNADHPGGAVRGQLAKPTGLAPQAKPPRIPAYYNGDVVTFTVVSDNVVGVDRPGVTKAAATLYAFGEPGDQPQIDVLDSVPGVPGYNPWWHVVVVAVLDERDVTTDPFTSEAELLAAEAAGEVALIETGFYFLCQVLP